LYGSNTNIFQVVIPSFDDNALLNNYFWICKKFCFFCNST